MIRDVWRKYNVSTIFVLPLFWDITLNVVSSIKGSLKIPFTQLAIEYGLENIQKVKEIELYNPLDINKQGPIILFSLGNNDPQKINILLDEISGIAVRSGMHCAQPIVSRLNPNGLLRASFYFYNTFEEIDVFIKTLKDIQKKFL
ncbi:MAG TPA: aminotransferase class V-fold PLP-dependent enzyme [Candidatus Diapherotrites archaeon]|nr:aminotransferase class V-fold PLP-dependent enzyme [Candidatus Diapherotrites archaeon]